MLLCGSFALHIRAVDRGCEVGTRSSLRPLGFEGRMIKQSSGEIRRENDIARSPFRGETKHERLKTALIIVAPPRTLAALRTDFRPDVKRRIVAELAKDLTRHPVGDIEKHLLDA